MNANFYKENLKFQVFNFNLDKITLMIKLFPKVF